MKPCSWHVMPCTYSFYMVQSFTRVTKYSRNPKIVQFGYTDNCTWMVQHSRQAPVLRCVSYITSAVQLAYSAIVLDVHIETAQHYANTRRRSSRCLTASPSLGLPGLLHTIACSFRGAPGQFWKEGFLPGCLGVQGDDVAAALGMDESKSGMSWMVWGRNELTSSILSLLLEVSLLQSALNEEARSSVAHSEVVLHAVLQEDDVAGDVDDAIKLTSTGRSRRSRGEERRKAVDSSRSEDRQMDILLDCSSWRTWILDDRCVMLLDFWLEVLQMIFSLKTHANI